MALLTWTCKHCGCVWPLHLRCTCPKMTEHYRELEEPWQ